MWYVILILITIIVILLFIKVDYKKSRIIDDEVETITTLKINENIDADVDVVTNLTSNELEKYGELIARSFFYTNEYLKYRNNDYGTFVIEYEDISGYITKELKQYIDIEYCSDDYMKEVYAVRKYVIKQFQKLLEEKTQYYAEVENDEDYTVLIINEK